MNAQTGQPLYELHPNEKVASVMAYTNIGVFWGEVVVKEQIRVSTWLRTNVAPEKMCLYNSKCILTLGTGSPKPISFSEMHLPTAEIVAFHLVPPAKDPVDYDPTEPNRHMEPITAFGGSFRFDGHLRLATTSTLGKYMEIARETFAGLYDVDISNLVMPALGVMHVPFVIIRQTAGIFTHLA
jgi:hypothetical protein